MAIVNYLRDHLIKQRCWEISAIANNQNLWVCNYSGVGIDKKLDLCIYPSVKEF